MKSAPVKPKNVDEAIWQGLTLAQKKQVVLHERLHEIYLLKGARFLNRC